MGNTVSYFLCCTCYHIICNDFLQVEKILFPQLKRDDLTLRTVKPDELLFSDYVNKLEMIFESNILGPQK